ncbi:hypothetical protein [Hymenobacter guriensis]|uniref:Uncharacterized protein n=1 Tax=Hymenobacter guriensis TaxID=2793065 RepID=A0ABS0L199_9BACT|nr:hypothetical protein [Hymenobacter guriensis]MBG8553898.1 hypothetical protein [Hymenobacter guriensis]
MYVDLRFSILLAVVLLPLLTGYCAYTHGRSFRLWFALGCLLPVGSFFVLVALLYRQLADPGEQLLLEAKAILATAEEEELMKKEE